MTGNHPPNPPPLGVNTAASVPPAPSPSDEPPAWGSPRVSLAPLGSFPSLRDRASGARLSGAVASAIISAAINGMPSPVCVTTGGGDALHVYFSLKGTEITEVCLEGDAGIVCEGTLSL